MSDLRMPDEAWWSALRDGLSKAYTARDIDAALETARAALATPEPPLDVEALERLDRFRGNEKCPECGASDPADCDPAEPHSSWFEPEQMAALRELLDGPRAAVLDELAEAVRGMRESRHVVGYKEGVRWVRKQAVLDLIEQARR